MLLFEFTEGDYHRYKVQFPNVVGKQETILEKEEVQVDSMFDALGFPKLACKLNELSGEGVVGNGDELSG